MQLELQNPLLTEFYSSIVAHTPDWQENASNYCLYFLRTAFGSNCRLPDTLDPRIEIAQKTNSEAVKIFAGFMAFLLCLPLTFFGVILWISSESHARAYSVACLVLKPTVNLS